MIEKITITNPKDTPIEYASKVFSKGSGFAFSRGLNLIVGPNGCGKSTLVNMMRKYLVIPEGKDCVSTSKLEYDGPFSEDYRKIEVCSGVILKADYKSNTFFMQDAFECFEHSMSGGASLEYRKRMSCKSDGQKTSVLTDFLLERISTSPKTVDYFQHANYPTYNWSDARRVNSYKEYIETNRIPYEDICSVILDEPDKNLDVFKVKTLAETLLSMSKKGLQAIVVIHNPLLIATLYGREDAHFVEMSEGYASGVITQVKAIIK
jgi:ABC-type multidrug transport system ATPase subunit